MTEKPFTFHISEYDEVVITKENDGREFFIGNAEDINMDLDYIIGLVDLLNELSDENEQLKHRIQKYYDTTNADGKQIISDLVDSFELDKIDTSWFNKGDVE